MDDYSCGKDGFPHRPPCCKCWSGWVCVCVGVFEGMIMKPIPLLIASVMCVLAATAAEPDAGTLSVSAQPLRDAVRKLDEIFSTAYQAAEIMAAIDAVVASGDQQALEALRFEALVKRNPLLNRQPLLFVQRHPYAYDHHNTHNFSPGAPNEQCNAKLRPGSALKMIDFAHDGEVRTILEAPEGVIRDPSLHWDGERILFSMQQNAQGDYHIHEIKSDGSDLRQLTHLPDTDNVHPLYLADDDIVFSSTREPKYCMCNRHIMGNIYRMASDGANIHQITKNTLFDRPTQIMPDGRILYDRWEYIDRNFGDAQALWTVNPDGSNQSLYWGNNTPSPGAVLDARIIPGTQKALAIFSSCHDVAWGALAIIDRRKGMDGRAPVERIWPASAMGLVRDPGTANNSWDDFMRVRPKYLDPYPLNDSFFLAARIIGGPGMPNNPHNRTGLFLIDIFGNEILLHSEKTSCFNPIPLAAVKRPMPIPSRRDFENRAGTMYIQDVYVGQHMQSVPRGTIKHVRVVETPEKRFWVPGVWGAQGSAFPAVNWHSFETKRIISTVPVEADGSAYFKVPSDRFIFFQLLDEHGMMVHSMRSGTVAQSGETTGCIGCHEDRRMAPPPPRIGIAPLALQRPPSDITGWRGTEANFNYMTEVQPIFNARCISCHDFGKAAGKRLNLAPDRNLVFNTSYNELWRKRLIRVIGGGPAETRPAYDWGSHASPLLRVIRNQSKDHEKVDITPDELKRIAAWVDLNAVFYPDYSSAYPNHSGGRSPLNQQQLNRLGSLTGANLNRQFAHGSNQGPLVSFDRPELSPILHKFKNHQAPEYIEALEIVRAGQQMLVQRPDVDMEGFELSGIDLWRDQRYRTRLEIEHMHRRAIRESRRFYDQDAIEVWNQGVR